MLQLLVDRRDELMVGDLVGVGDLFDVLAEHYEPFTEDLKRNFEHAKELLRDQFQPLLRADHHLSDGQRPESGHPFYADERLVKTLLLAALVPQTQPLRNLDVAKLTALNHGSIRTPLPGGERAVALQRLRRWSAQVGALKVGADQQNPSVEVRLTGIDLDQIIARAEAVDNAGTRRQMIKLLVLDELGVEADTRLMVEHSVLWRGTRRTVDVVFGNIRDNEDLPDDVLRSAGDRWKVVIDYPFDPGHSPHEDLERLERWQSEHGGVQTVCWIPAFLSHQLQLDLKRLVIVDHVLGGERLAQHADHLSPQDRQQAHGLLEDHRSALEQRLRTAIRQAYGVEAGAPDAIDTSHGVEDRLRSLAGGFVPQVQVGNQLGEAFERLLRSMLDHQFPDHPRFEAEVKPALLRTVLSEVERAAETSEGRIEVPSDRRLVMRRIANPLELGVQHEVAFLLATKWKDHLDRAIRRATQDGAERVTVGDLRRWLEEPRPLGLTREVGSLVILSYAAQTSKGFAGADPTLDRLDDDLELVAAELPDESAWRQAVSRAASVLGKVTLTTTRNPGSVDKLSNAVRERSRELADDAEKLPGLLENRIEELGGDPSDADRLRTATAAAALVRSVIATDGSAAAVERFAGGELPTSEPATGTSLSSAGQLVRVLEDARWQVLELVAKRAEAGEEAFDAIRAELLDSLRREELAESLDEAIGRAHERAVALLQPQRVPNGGLDDVETAQARAKLDELDREGRPVKVSLSWTFSAPASDG